MVPYHNASGRYHPAITTHVKARNLLSMHHICELGSRGDSHPDSADSTSRRCVCSSCTASVHSPGSSRCRCHTLGTAWWACRSRCRSGPCVSGERHRRDIRHAVNGGTLCEAMRVSRVSRQCVKSLFSSSAKGQCSLWTGLIILGFKSMREVFCTPQGHGCQGKPWGHVWGFQQPEELHSTI